MAPQLGYTLGERLGNLLQLNPTCLVSCSNLDASKNLKPTLRICSSRYDIRIMMKTIYAALVLAITTTLTASAAGTADPLDWPYCLGPRFDRTSMETGLLDDFDAKKDGPGSNVLWKRTDLRPSDVDVRGHRNHDAGRPRRPGRRRSAVARRLRPARRRAGRRFPRPRRPAACGRFPRRWRAIPYRKIGPSRRGQCP